jgi:nucleoid-associated protein YgaU
MNETVAKLSALSALLVAVWVGVYWLTPAEPRITVADLSGESKKVPEEQAKQPAPRERASGIPTPVETEAAPLPVREPVAPPGTPKVADQVPNPQAAKVIPPEFTEHIVQKNETFESIAKKYFGAKASGSIIAKANPFMDPRRLRPGRVVRIPRDPNNIQGIAVPTPAQPEETPASVPTGPRTYVVVAGDTLSKISAKMYGESRHADEIFGANRGQLADEHSLSIGQVIIIPDIKRE